MREVRAFVNGGLKFNIWELLAAQLRVLFQHRFEGIDRNHED
jgi:hypothetical protein